jgi:hypothetical protein
VHHRRTGGSILSREALWATTRTSQPIGPVRQCAHRISAALIDGAGIVFTHSARHLRDALFQGRGIGAWARVENAACARRLAVTADMLEARWAADGSAASVAAVSDSNIISTIFSQTDSAPAHRPSLWMNSRLGIAH